MIREEPTAAGRARIVPSMRLLKGVATKTAATGGMMTRYRQYLTIGLTLLAAGLPFGAAQGSADWPLAGQTVRLVVGYGAGGGFDAYARLLAPHLEARTGATVVVDNRPGGGGQTATNQMMREPADGLVQYLINGTPAALAQTVESPGVDYDLAEFTWLGRINAEPGVVIVNEETPFETVADLAAAAEPVIFAAGSRIDGMSDGGAILCEALQIDCRIVLGFQGSAEASLSVIRGETDAIVMSDTSAQAAAQDDNLRAIAVLGQERSEFFPQVPTVAEQFDLSMGGDFWIRYRTDLADIGRSLVLPPGASEDTVAYLRSVWESILTDPGVVAEGAASGRPIRYQPGDAQESVIAGLLSQVALDRQTEIRAVLLTRYF